MLVKDEPTPQNTGEVGMPTTYRIELKDSTHSGKKTILINGTEIISQMKL